MSAAMIALVGGCLGLAVWMELSLRAHVALSLAMVAAGLLIAQRAQQLRLLLVFLSVSASLRYMAWRATESLSWGSFGDTALSLALFGAELYALISLLGGYFQTAIMRRREPVDLGPYADVLPTVDLLIPTYNEPLDVVRPTILGALAQDYPHVRVVVLDDGRREEIRQLCHELGCDYMTRSDNRGAKAGNINAALARTRGELVAIFDADHIPVRTFLTKTVGFFLENRRVGLVQTPHHFYNPDPFERNLGLAGHVPPEQHFFYHSIQLGNDFWNSVLFCGTCAVLRREALDEVGGICEATVTEDAHTSLNMLARGWDSVFLDIPLAAGLATESLADHISQRIRWARGMAQIFRLDNPLTKRGLTLAQRINYFNANWHFFHGLPRLAFIVVPVAYLVFDLHPVDANVRELLLYAFPHLLLGALGAATMHRNVRHSIWPEVYELAVAPYTAMVTALAMIAPRFGRFNVTAKGNTRSGTTFDLRHAWPLVVLYVGTLFALLAAPARGFLDPVHGEAIIVAALWCVYNLVILTAALATALEQPQRRQHHRINRLGVARLLWPSSDGVNPWDSAPAFSTDLSMGGVQLTLEGDWLAPDLFYIELYGDGRRPVTLPASVLRRRMDGDKQLLHCSFVDVDPRRQRELSRLLFSEPRSWLDDRYRPDRLLISAWTVLIAPVTAYRRGPGRILARLLAEEPTQHIVPRSTPSHCHVCQSPLEPGDLCCMHCSTDTLHSFGASAPLPRPAPRKGLQTALAPGLLAAAAVALAIGWAPVTSAMSLWLPMELPDPVEEQAGLDATHAVLTSLRHELAASVDGHTPQAADWPHRLQEATQASLTRRLQTDRCGQHLVQASRALASAAYELEQGVGQQHLQARLTTVDDSLDAAGRELEIRR